MVLPGEVICMRSEIRNRRGQVVIWTMILWIIRTKRQCFFEELQTNKPKNYIFTSKELKINLNMEQPKNHELNNRAVFHLQTVPSQWEVQRLLELKMDPNETCEPHGTSAVHQVGGSRVKRNTAGSHDLCFLTGGWRVFHGFFISFLYLSELPWQVSHQAAIGGHCEVLRLLQNFGAVLWQKTGVAWSCWKCGWR